MTKNQQYIENRIKEEAKYIINTKCTVRKAAKQFSVSKSVIHRDIIKKLPEIDFLLKSARTLVTLVMR